jgi:hypothetical protein
VAKRERTFHGVWAISLLLAGAVGLFLVRLSFQGYAVWRGLADSIARDGQFQSLTPTVQAALVWPARGLGGLALLGLALSLAWPECSQQALSSVLHAPGRLVRRFGRDLRSLPALGNPQRDGHGYRLALLGIILLGLLTRLPYLTRPVIHDEAYTVETWASGSLRYAIEDYHLPNNHIFHTLLVQQAFRHLGSQPWMIRLPAFLAGALLIPLGYALARRWYGQPAGLLAGGLIAVAPIVANYSSLARGYSLFMLFTLAIFWLASGLLRRNNLVGWLLLVLCAGLGFWTVPMMLYPFGGVCAWIALSAFFDHTAARAYGGPRRLLAWLAVAGALSGLLALFLYAPVLLKSGTQALFGNQFVAPLSADVFVPTLFHSRLPETWREWSTGFTLAGAGLLSLGVLASLALNRRLSTYHVHALLAIVLWVTPVIFIQRPNLWPRVSSYLYPLGFVWAAGGLVGLAGLLGQRWLPAVAGVGVAAALALGGVHALQTCPGGVCGPGEEQQAVTYLQTQLQADDLVLVESPSDAPVWYYFRQAGLSKDHFRKDHAFFRAFLLLRPADGQTAEQLIAYRGPELAFFDLSTLQRLASFGQLEVYEVQAYPELIRQAYGVQ